MHTRILTLGALKESGIRTKPVRDEIRDNLIAAMKEGRNLFPDIIGYDKTVIPQLVNALLSRHDILLLGLRGQAKTRIARSLTQFLDEWIPVVAGSSLNEDPFHPITGPTKKMIGEIGDETPVAWLHREERYQEKLATPDVSMADLIGDIDPISALETLVSNVERRVILTGDANPVPRLSDLFSLLPAVTGKLELVYEGEQKGATIVATRLIGRAVKSVFTKYFPAVHEDRRRPGGPKEPLYDQVQSWFNGGHTIEITDHRPSDEERAALESIPGLRPLAEKYVPDATEEERASIMEIVLEGLHQHSVLSREGLYGSATYGDMLSRMMQDL